MDQALESEAAAAESVASAVSAEGAAVVVISEGGPAEVELTVVIGFTLRGVDATAVGG